jgi:hypothetical protein
MNADLNLSVLRRQMQAQKTAEQNVHNLAKSMFQEGTKVQFMITLADDRKREYFGSVVFVCGIPGTTRLRVRNLSTQKEREISLSQVTGLVKEE